MAGVAAKLVVRHAGRLLTMDGPPIENAALVVDDEGRVAWVGEDGGLPAYDGPEVDAAGALVGPGFVDAHTHLVWAGSRRDELVARLAGETYDGGGIATTATATRDASDHDLLELATQRVTRALAHGTTTLEVKTGYGLEVDAELRLAWLVTALAERVPARIEPTLLAHVVPEGVGAAEHLVALAESMPEAARRGARWFDVFCDERAFGIADAETLLTAARAAGLGLRMHAEQLGRNGGALLAADRGCASADHLEHVIREDAEALAAAGTVAVLLPTASLTTRQPWAPVATLREAGVTLALGTDCNPGTSWCESMPYVLHLACFAMGMSVDEAWRAATVGAAASLRRTDIGSLTPGSWADVVMFDAEHEADVIAHLGGSHVASTYVAGTRV